jgi:ankyrin repeat protein
VTALIIAARHGYTEIVKELIAAGASLDFLGETQMTALVIAARHGYTEIVQELIAAGA